MAKSEREWQRGREREIQSESGSHSEGPLNFNSELWRWMMHNNHKYSLWCLIVWFHFLRDTAHCCPTQAWWRKAPAPFLLSFVSAGLWMISSIQYCLISTEILPAMLPSIAQPHSAWWMTPKQLAVQQTKWRSSSGRVGGLVVSFSSQTARKSANVKDFLTAHHNAGAGRSLWGDLSRAPPLSLNRHY